MKQRNKKTRFHKDETGAMTSLWLFLTISMAITAGMAIDFSNVAKARTHLQVTADLTAHAALYKRDFLDNPADAKTAALELAASSMPNNQYGQVITAEDITFGDYDIDNDIFTPNPNSREAVYVLAKRIDARSNAVTHRLLNMIGMDYSDVMAGSLFTTYHPSCLREGYIAEQEVELNSNGNYTNGFCIHSNDHVDFQNNNTFEDGVIVSMPDSNDIDLSGSGWESNTGLTDAVRDDRYRLRDLNRIDDYINDVEALSVRRLGGYLEAPVLHYVEAASNGKIDETYLTEGDVHVVSCGNKSRLTINRADVTQPIKNVAIVTDCPIKMGSEMELQNVIIATRATSADAIEASSKVTLGLDDGCAEGGGVVLLSKGGVIFTSQLSIFGSKILADGDVKFTANSDGIEGASIVAGGTIDGTSNGQAGACGNFDNSAFTAAYFKMAR